MLLNFTSYSFKHLRDIGLSWDPYHKILCKGPLDLLLQMPFPRPINEVTFDAVIVPAMIMWIVRERNMVFRLAEGLTDKRVCSVLSHYER